MIEYDYMRIFHWNSSFHLIKKNLSSKNLFVRVLTYSACPCDKINDYFENFI
jgi:hypothetical protein